jgi:hypothetical protein
MYKKKLLLGGLATKGIKAAYKKYVQEGGRKTFEIVKEEIKRRTKGATKSQQLKQDPSGRIKQFKFPIRDYHRIYGESTTSVLKQKPAIRGMAKNDIKARLRMDSKLSQRDKNKLK